MTDPLFERFLNPVSMMEAEQELIAQGEGAVPLLESLLNGQAKNEFGVPYRQLGLPLRCALEVACRLGPIAKPLEPFLCTELRSGNHIAAMALGSLGRLKDLSIGALAASLTGDLDLAFESAAALIRCGCTDHPSVLKAASESEKVSRVLARVVSQLGNTANQ